MDEVADDEYLLRHIPGGTLWQAPGPRITSANFQLRHDRQETGVSVTRWKITTPQRLLELVGAVPQQVRVLFTFVSLKFGHWDCASSPNHWTLIQVIPRSNPIRRVWTTMPVGRNWRCCSNS
jgi:hypothetical protein